MTIFFILLFLSSITNDELLYGHSECFFLNIYSHSVCKHGVFHQYELEYEIEGFLSGQNVENSTGTGKASLQCVSAHGFEGGL